MGNEVTEQVIRLDGDVKNLHCMADDPFEVIMARLGVVSLEPTSARERVAVCVEGNVAAGPNLAPHVLGACWTRHTEVCCIYSIEVFSFWIVPG